MATTANTTATTATTAGKAAAPAAPAKGKAAAPAAPAAPVYTVANYNPATNNGWPVKAQGGNSIRAYCYSVAKALAKAHPKGFTAAQYASALAANAAGTTYKQPSTGWGTAAKPNGAAHAHANWFANPKQAWLVPVAPASK